MAVGLAFSVAPHTAVRTADAVSMKAEESATVAQTIAEEGAVLLRNTGVLPLRATDRVEGSGAAQANIAIRWRKRLAENG